MVCEILPTHGEADERWAFRKPRQDALLDLMRSAGYRMFRLLETGGAMRLEGIEPHSDLALSNYAFVRSAAEDAFLRAIGATSATSEVA